MERYLVGRGWCLWLVVVDASWLEFVVCGSLLHHTADEGRWVSFALNYYTQSSSSNSRRRNGLTTSWRQEQQEQQERQHEGQHTWQHVGQQDMQQEHKKGIHNGKTVPMQTVARSATGTATKHTNVKCITIASFIIFVINLNF